MWIVYTFLFLVIYKSAIEISRDKIMPFWEKRLIKKHPPVYNGITPKYSFSKFGFLYGLWDYGFIGNNFRIDPKNNSEVKYAYISLLFVIVIPIGCFRVKVIERDEHDEYDEPKISKDGIDLEPIIKVYGTEKWSVIEILFMYLSSLWFIFLFSFVIYILCTFYKYVENFLLVS